MSLTESSVEDGSLRKIGERGYAGGLGPLMSSGEHVLDASSIVKGLPVHLLWGAVPSGNGAVLDEMPEQGAQEMLCFSVPLGLLQGQSLRGLLSITLDNGWSGAASTSKAEAGE